MRRCRCAFGDHVLCVGVGVHLGVVFCVSVQAPFLAANVPAFHLHTAPLEDLHVQACVVESLSSMRACFGVCYERGARTDCGRGFCLVAHG